jgi:hypothetical protein
VNGRWGWKRAESSSASYSQTIFSTDVSFFDHVEERIPLHTFHISVAGAIRLSVDPDTAAQAINTMRISLVARDEAFEVIGTSLLTRGQITNIGAEAQTVISHIGFDGMFAIGAGQSRRPIHTFEIVLDMTGASGVDKFLLGGSITINYNRPIADVEYNGRPVVVASGISAGQTLRVLAGVSMAIIPDAERMTLAGPQGIATQVYDTVVADTLLMNVAMLFPTLFTNEEYAEQVARMQQLVEQGDAFSFKKLKSGIKLAKKAADMANKLGVPGAKYANMALTAADKGARMLPDQGNVPFTGRAVSDMYSSRAHRG